MSASHNHNLLLTAIHQKLWGFDHTWIDVKCYPDQGGTEICDQFGVLPKAVRGLWLDDFGKEVYLPAGISMVGEYEDTKSDLIADQTKSCRDRRNKAMGDYRLVWIREDGKIRPADIDEEGPHYGWGVVVLNDHRAEIVRPPLRMPNVARGEGMRVYGEMLCRDHKQSLAEMGSNLGAMTSSVETTSAPRSETIRKDSGEYVDKHAQAAEAYVEAGPCTTAQLMRHLEDETNWVGSPPKLTKHLRTKSSRLQAPPPGGNWTIKGDSNGG